jgi:poly(3-hydroxybutyrate) depolymerase
VSVAHRAFAVAMLGICACAGDNPAAQTNPDMPLVAAGTGGAPLQPNAAGANAQAGQTGAAGKPMVGAVTAGSSAAGASAAGQTANVPAAGDGAAGAGPAAAGGGAAGTVANAPSSADSSSALMALSAYLEQARASRPKLAEQDFANVALTKADAQSAKDLLWKDFAEGVRETRAEEVGATESQAKTVRVEGNDKVLRYYMAKRGSMPAGGWSLFISMHGGGNAPAATNDSQWENQISLVEGYDPKDALWVAPRAPIDDWNMFFIQEIDELLERLITDLIVFENVDPNKVYINGYSAGGDAVYQLGPRMGERWAGAGMSAGHPNASSPLSLRNVPFAIHVGGNDTAYDRNKKAEEWGKRLEMLAAEDMGGYINQWQVHAGKPHWMDMEDAVSIPFLQSHTRNPIPSKIVWEQAEYPRAHFYWLAADQEADRVKGALIRADYDATGVHISDVQDVKQVSIRLNDDMLDLDAPIRVDFKGQMLLEAPVKRTIAMLDRCIQELGDPGLVFSAQVSVDVP